MSQSLDNELLFVFRALVHAKWEYEEIRKLMDAENPIIALIFEMKERDGYTVAEISEQTGVTKRNVYYYLDRARAIGQQYNRD